MSSFSSDSTCSNSDFTKDFSFTSNQTQQAQDIPISFAKKEIKKSSLSKVSKLSFKISTSLDSACNSQQSSDDEDDDVHQQRMLLQQQQLQQLGFEANKRLGSEYYFARGSRSEMKSYNTNWNWSTF